jgi:glycosyltransferase involved in cell wall biosynthesis
MHVLEIVSGLGVDGAVVHPLLLSKELIRRGHRVTVARIPGSWLAARLAEAGIPSLDSRVSHLAVRDLVILARATRRLGVDVVHSHRSAAHSCGVALRWLAGVPSVATAQSEYIQLHWPMNDRVLATSEHASRFHRRWNFVPPRRIEVVPNFVQVGPPVPPDSASLTALRASLGIAESDRVIGFVGRLAPQKGLDDLLRAMPAVLRRDPAARLLVVGSGRLAMVEQLRGLAAELGVAPRVLWTGARNDVAALRGVMELVAMPSRWESTSLHLLESMAAGLPVVAMATGGTPECVSDGVSGFLVPRGDVPALADRLCAVLADPERGRQVGAAARLRVEREFSAEVIVPRIEAALAGVVRMRQARRPGGSTP